MPFKNRFFVLLFLLISISIVSGEIAIRMSGKIDEDGNFSIDSLIAKPNVYVLKPYHLPLKSLKKYINCSTSANSFLVYDPFLGWAPKPNSNSQDGLYYYNSHGIRVSHRPNKKNNNSPIKIALFGDSFTAAYDVPFENSWGYYLENNLKKSGFKLEVLNFGVGGYGMDQAFLRYKAVSSKFSPDIVIFGFQPENTRRNLNMIRSLYNHSFFPFSKPRFVFENKIFKLINSPCPSPKKLLDIMEHIDNWSLIKYEYFYSPDDFRANLLNNSKLISFALYEFYLALAKINKPQQEDKISSDLAIEIIKQFKKIALNNHKHYLIVHLPTSYNLREMRSHKIFRYSDLLYMIGNIAPVIHPESAMLKEFKNNSRDSIFANKTIGHYSAKGNKIVADVITEYFLKHKYLFKRQINSHSHL